MVASSVREWSEDSGYCISSGKTEFQSRNPTEVESAEPYPVDVQVAAVTSKDHITDLLSAPPGEESLSEFHREQNKDPTLQRIRVFLDYGILPTNDKEARKLAYQALNFAVVDNVLYFVDAKGGCQGRMPREDAGSGLQCQNTCTRAFSKTIMPG